MAIPSVTNVLDIMVDCEAINLDAALEVFPYNPYAGYVTGGWPIEWFNSQFNQVLRKIRIAQSAVSEADFASEARTLDVERYAATPDDWPEFFDTRTNQEDATCYCSLSTVPFVLDACERAQIQLPPRWWLAWYWQRPGFPTVPQIQSALQSFMGTRPMIKASTIWACQAQPFPKWDLSKVYGLLDFARR